MIARPIPFSSSTPCNPKQLERLSLDALSDAELASITIHLSQCAACRADLDRRDQTDIDWNSAKSTVQTSLFGAGSDSSIGIAVTAKKQLDRRSRSLISWLEPCDEAHLGRDFIGRLDSYWIKRVVGTGGMGVVLEGWDEQLHRPVAIKAMHPHLASIGIARQRFVREARAAAAIVHPNVVAIHAVNADYDPPYLVMPLIAGESLQARMDRTGILEIDAVLRIASQVADGLAAAHAQGLVHRDVKPANILVEHGTERAMITDFGVVRALDDATMTTSGGIAGTPEYMSPEQARGDALDFRSDLFSLGSVMYAMLSGRSPFRADSPLRVMRRISDDPPRSIREFSPHLPLWMVSVIEWLHEKNPSLRANSASDVANELRRALAYWHDPMHHPLPSLIANRMQRTRTPRWVVWCVSGLICTLAILGFASFNRPMVTPHNDAIPNEMVSQPAPLEDSATSTPPPLEDTTLPSENVLDDHDYLLRIEIDLAIESVAQEIETLEATMIDK